MSRPTAAELAGRDRELATAGELVTALAGGRGGLAWIGGEPGIGKSALADVITARAAAAGCRVFRGGGDELAQAFPLRLMADCLGISERSADPRQVMIARLLRGEASDSGAIDAVLAASERILELVDRYCADRPVLLAAEDLHWADEPSLLVWNRLARATDQIPLLLIGTTRPAAQRPTVTRLGDLVCERGGTVLDLAPLNPDDVTRLAGRITGAPPGPALKGELARAGGNPLYVRELVDALVRDGQVTQADGVAEFHGDSGATPGSVTLAIGSRLRFYTEYTDESASVLRRAALLGHDFDLDELAVATGQSVAALSGVVEEAIAAGVVVTAGQRLKFRHELIQQVLVEQISPVSRAALHGHIARELAAAGARPEIVARHLLAVPDHNERWVQEWLAEVPEPMLSAVPQVSAELIDRVLSSAGTDDRAWAVLAARRAQLLFWLGRDEQAADLAAQVSRRSADPLLATRMRILTLRSAGRIGRLQDALPIALAPMDTRIPPAYQARLGAWSAVLQAIMGRAREAGAMARTALRQSRQAGDPLATGYALHALTLVSDAPAALGLIDEALTGLGHDPESADLRLLLLNNRLNYLTSLGRREDVAESLPSALVLAERAGTFRAVGLLATAAEACYLQGAWDDALVHLDGIEPEFLSNWSNLNPAALAALIALHRGDREKADQYLAATGVDEPSAGPGSAANWRLTAAWALRAESAGDTSRALELMATWLDPSPIPGQETRHELLPHLVRLALDHGDRDLAAAAVAASEADAASGPQPGKLASARCCRAQLDDDPAGLLAAAGSYLEHGWPLERATALEEAAVRLAAGGDLTQARAVFNDVIKLYFGLGASWDLRRTEARLRPHGIRRGPRALSHRPVNGWEALTPSETRIAELVARGLSNPDIATELYVSRRTVQTHVSNILIKLDLRSRVEVAREYASRTAQ
jgi:DNA-binding CsgD family transcriptional regulator/tetratricopeptide (TPR) repeat protein